jgi:hypothetical protein
MPCVLLHRVPTPARNLVIEHPHGLFYQLLCCRTELPLSSSATYLMRLPPSPLNQAHIAARCCLMCCLSAGLSNLGQ